MSYSDEHEDEIDEARAAEAMRRAAKPLAIIVDCHGHPRDYLNEIKAIAQTPGQTGPSGFGFGGSK